MNDSKKKIPIRFWMGILFIHIIEEYGNHLSISAPLRGDNSAVVYHGMGEIIH